MDRKAELRDAAGWSAEALKAQVEVYKELGPGKFERRMPPETHFSKAMKARGLEYRDVELTGGDGRLGLALAGVRDAAAAIERCMDSLSYNDRNSAMNCLTTARKELDAWTKAGEASRPAAKAVAAVQAIADKDLERHLAAEKLPLGDLEAIADDGAEQRAFERTEAALEGLREEES